MSQSSISAQSSTSNQSSFDSFRSSSIVSQSLASSQSSSRVSQSSFSTQSFASFSQSLASLQSSISSLSVRSSIQSSFKSIITFNNSSNPFVIVQNSSIGMLSCMNNDQCPSGFCFNGACQQLLALNSVCADSAQCISGLCLNGICRLPSVDGIACVVDSDCPAKARCILSRCLTVTDIAQLPAFCGNARIDSGEICDDGPRNSDSPNALCRTNCIPPRCGDGVIDSPFEQCDDGNNSVGDGCSSMCTSERNSPTTTETLPASVIELPFSDNGRDDQGMGNSYSGQRNDSVNNGSDTGLNNATGMHASVISSAIPSTPDTGPAALAVMIAGGAAGWLYRRRK